MNTKLLSATLATLMATGIASAQVGVTAQVNVDVRAQATTSQASGSARTEATTSVRGNATSSAKKSEKATTTTTVRATTTKSNASVNGQEHMSAVARFVQSLLAVANREGGIGAQVRVIAQAQNDTASSSATAITKLESRGKLRTLLFGTDYKSVGQLRSDMATTEANIEALQKLLEKTTNTTTKAELEAEIKALQAAQVKLDAFVKAHESSFSLFGWMNK